ncbi:hypothetical protein Vadar_017264 [Vaccinium darrowii]|uniref:Uncharacterized protein n=1 Tax=Vaccinium darrowii TaxID=229202 RepID=A0ACB7Z471_9ERIC|nr:hypothetical protein Vadar_017264 [Vaccinium darrowii]
MNDAEAPSFCPSFNNYPSNQSAQITTDITRNKSHTSCSFDDDFEFAFIRDGNLETTPDEISHDGYEIYKIFPVFNRDNVLFGDDRDCDDDAKPNFKSILCSPKELFDEEHDPPLFLSSSEVDKLQK